MAGGTRSGSGVGASAKKDESTEENKTDFGTIIEKLSELCKQLGALDYIKTQVGELTKSVNFHTAQYEDYHKTVKGLIEENKATQVELQVVMNTLADVKKENEALRARVDDMEQEARAKDVEIVGFPETQGEHLATIVKVIGQKAGTEVLPEDIDYVERVPQEKKPRPLLVQFKTRKVKETFLKKAREARFKANAFNDQFSDGPIFVNEHLTHERKKLIYEARKKKNELIYKYLWTKGGVIFLKKTDESSVIRVTTEKDLAKIV